MTSKINFTEKFLDEEFFNLINVLYKNLNQVKHLNETNLLFNSFGILMEKLRLFYENMETTALVII